MAKLPKKVIERLTKTVSKFQRVLNFSLTVGEVIGR